MDNNLTRFKMIYNFNWLSLKYLKLSMMKESFDSTRPIEGITDWSDASVLIVGNFMLYSPIFCVIIGAVLYLVFERTDVSFQANRNVLMSLKI